MSFPPVLLTFGKYYGTLAAARNLGRAGIPVTLAERGAFAPVRWSRHVSRCVHCPDAQREPEAFVSWLLEFGRASPGHVLLPTSDDTAWLFAANREALAEHFRMLPTPLDAVEAVLDKSALIGHCHAVGLDVPETWLPTSEEEAAAIANEVGFPLLLKPRTQVLHASGLKGRLVEDAGALVAGLREMIPGDRYGAPLRQRSPDVAWPMLQRYYPGAQENIYSLTGYAGEGGEILGVRAARKILQRPRRLGIGLCFEEAPVDERLVDRVGALIARIGYRGVFEMELIDAGTALAVIDFNPRFYGQMAFEISRGLALPRFAYADAIGDRATLRALTDEARTFRSSGRHAYCHGFMLEVMLRAQRLSGRLGTDDVAAWRRWRADHQDHLTDAVADADDRAPWGVDVAHNLALFARHPRSFVRTVVLDR